MSAFIHLANRISQVLGHAGALSSDELVTVCSPSSYVRAFERKAWSSESSIAPKAYWTYEDGVASYSTATGRLELTLTDDGLWIEVGSGEYKSPVLTLEFKINYAGNAIGYLVQFVPEAFEKRPDRAGLLLQVVRRANLSLTTEARDLIENLERIAVALQVVYDQAKVVVEKIGRRSIPDPLEDTYEGLLSQTAGMDFNPEDFAPAK